MYEACLTRETSDVNLTNSNVHKARRLLVRSPHMDCLTSSLKLSTWKNYRHLGTHHEVLIRGQTSTEDFSFPHHHAQVIVCLLPIRDFAFLSLHFP
jgi:hypothetical protein